jgi:hypothetical protein
VNIKSVIALISIFSLTSLQAAEIVEYKFNTPSTSAIDTSGNNVHGQFIGGPGKYVPGMPGHGLALQMDGIDDFIHATDRPILDITKAYTLAAWVYTRGDNKTEFIYKGAAYWYGVLDARDIVRAGGFYRTCTLPSRYRIFDSAGIVPDEVWTHVAVTYDGTAITTYINGQPERSPRILGPVCTSNTPLVVGASFVPGKKERNHLNGMIDDAHVFNNALTLAQIHLLMQEP